MSPNPKEHNRYSLYAMAALYVMAGVNHFINPEMYLKIMPSWLCCHNEIVLISGVCEIVLGILLLFPRTRPMAAWGVIVLLIVVFPANVQAFLNHLKSGHSLIWLSGLRLPLQVALIWWAYLFTRPAK